MSFRISTAGLHSAVITQMLAQQGRLSATQTQIASGKRIQSPADDPIAATQITAMEQARTQLAQYAKNADALTSRLNVGEQAMADATNLLQRVRELTVQSNSAALDASARGSIAAELSARVQELQDLANRRDANGEYLFAGLSTQTQPFSRTAGGVAYAGDQGTRALEISADQRVVDGFSGYQTFMNVPEGNGTFSVAEGVHVGASSIDSGQITNAAAWVPGSYTLQFTGPATWEVFDAANVSVAGGGYTSGSTIAFNGAQVVVTGTPATGDTYAIAAAGKESIFTTIDKLITSLTTALDGPIGRSTLNTQAGSALTQLDQALSHLINQRAEIGARLNTVDNATASRQQLDDSLTASVGKMQDLDYATAVSNMNQQLLGLQAAQAAYGRISQLSLFNYL